MGKIIVFEGIDGCGKTVQFNMVKSSLKELGYKVACMEFPVYSSYFGQIIGQYLSGKTETDANKVDPMSMALWFAMDRAYAFSDFHEEYDILLINRYVLSNAVYQSIRYGDRTEDRLDEMQSWVFNLEHNVLKLPVPDMYIFLDVSEMQAGKNVDNKGYRDYVGDGKDVYEKLSDIQTDARNGYLKCADKYSNIEVVSCMENGSFLSPEKIHCMVMQRMKQNNIIE